MIQVILFYIQDLYKLCRKQDSVESTFQKILRFHPG